MSAAETIRTRTGDWKAKTLLLPSSLEALDVEAHAAMSVPPWARSAALRTQPLVFYHVIVRVRHYGRDHRRDYGPVPGEPPHALAQAELRYALPLDGQTGDLVEMPRREHSKPDVSVRDTYYLSGGPQMPGRLRREMT